MAANNDTLPTATRVSDPGIRALYRLENRWQAWLDVEAALARAQAELGIIPSEAAEAIAAKAKFELMDRARIDEGFARTGHTLVPLVWELGRIVGEPHGGWVHWGATTQNITQTGDLLVLRQAHAIFLRQIGEVLELHVCIERIDLPAALFAIGTAGDVKPCAIAGKSAVGQRVRQ